jgi:peptidoglycan/xylan/chitin deacetylase (PgdA/CDA1 family)
MPTLTHWLDAGRRRLRVMMFHGVGVPSYPAEAFARQLSQLAARFDIVGIDQALQLLHSDRAPKRPPMVLTFDDGLRNNHRVAYPLLARLNLHGVFYVCPGLIDQQQWLWNHEARERLGAMPAAARQALAARLGAAASEVLPWVEWMKGLPAERCNETLRQIREATPDFAPTAGQREAFDMMSWDELQQLDPAVVTVGSHTVSHPILTSLQPAQLQHEIGASRQWLEERLRRPVAHFCYPNGANNPAAHAAAAATYDTAVTTHYGYVGPGDDRHLLRRIGATPKPANLAWRLHRRYPAAS